ncbi:MAG: phage minor structural protein [Clostridia bacterium]|nr:phage minor structural protein [Clostridia bacterium]
MIKILNSAFKRLVILKKAENPVRSEEINGENTLNFSTELTEKLAQNVDENSIIELENDYFDIAYYLKGQAENGLLSMDIQAEHVSYRLNNPEYDMEYFTATGTPETILAQMLVGTEFAVGTVEFTKNTTYSAQEAKSRRQILMEFIAQLGGEADFNKFEISIVAHRGNTTRKLLTKGKNIKVVSKVYDKRQADEAGNALVAYACEPIQLENTKFALGDEALLIQKDLGIQQQLRIVKISYNPYNNLEASIELANFIDTIETQMYRMETKTVIKDKLYYGSRIGPEFGFECVRSDKLARSIYNADTIAMQAGDGLGSYVDKLYFNPLEGEFVFDGTIYAASGVFSGDVTAATITGGSIMGSTIDIGEDGSGGYNFSVDVAGHMNAKTGTFGGTIETVENARVGNNLYLGDTNNTGKAIVFSASASISNPYGTDAVLLSALGNIEFETPYDVDFSSVNVVGLGNSGYVKQSAINAAIADHIAAYHV